jgi:hypothetical protein
MGKAPVEYSANQLYQSVKSKLPPSKSLKKKEKREEKEEEEEEGILIEQTVVKKSGESDILDEGIDISFTYKSNIFEYPTRVGIPTINYRPDVFDNTTIEVGPNKRVVTVLSGRTFLAR